MQYLFSPRNRKTLKEFALSRTLVAFDFDGTLAPIVRDRHRAEIRQSTKDRLAVLASLYPTVVISGRARSDVQRRLRGTGVGNIIGNHGCEPWSTSPGMEKSVQNWLPALKQGLLRFPGVKIENKRFSVAIHYRDERRKRAACAAIAAAARDLPAVRIVGGKQVVNILPGEAPGKGLALEREMRETHCKKAIYIGDDETDEDVFALRGHGRVLTIRVGANRDSLARYYIRNQREIDRLIQTLVDLRCCGTRPARTSA